MDFEERHLQSKAYPEGMCTELAVWVGMAHYISVLRNVVLQPTLARASLRVDADVPAAIPALRADPAPVRRRQH